MLCELNIFLEPHDLPSIFNSLSYVGNESKFLVNFGSGSRNKFLSLGFDKNLTSYIKKPRVSRLLMK
ncbi:hypothetical protein JOC55_006067 [Paenibacillus sacheonensis]|nr:hypothetical protein [Paenibacillus sacheonensis]